jgi:2,4-didehydro-3-deoxy-L-rhamnonate hydrolase
MKLCRYGKDGFEKPGMIDAQGKLRDLSKVVDNIGPNEISPRGLKMLSKVKPETLPLVPAARGWACPTSASASSSPSG